MSGTKSHGNKGFALIVVLFVLLIIVGAAYTGPVSGGSCGCGGGYGGYGYGPMGY
jgi:uncharacterized protein (TIGR01732 family)